VLLAGELRGSRDVLVTVPCVAPLFSTLRFDYFKWELTWDIPAPVDVLRGDLDALRANGGDFQGTVIACEATDMPVWTQVIDEPAPGNGFYYLAREAGPTYVCGPSWGTGSPAELPGAVATAMPTWRWNSDPGPRCGGRTQVSWLVSVLALSLDRCRTSGAS
jgi:hypothetical protein